MGCDNPFTQRPDERSALLVATTSDTRRACQRSTLARHDRSGPASGLEFSPPTEYLPSATHGNLGLVRIMASTNPFRFVQQVRSEVSKVVWPTRREVALTTVMVFVLATLTAVFFFIVDWLIRNVLQFTLSGFG